MNGEGKLVMGSRFCPAEAPLRSPPGLNSCLTTPEQCHLVVGQSMELINTNLPLKTGSHWSAGRRVPFPSKMAPLSDERREEVTRNFNGLSTKYPIVVD